MPKFQAAFAYQDDVQGLPVADIAAASDWYCSHFGMEELRRASEPAPTVILVRDGVEIGFAENGGDASQDGAAILVSEIHEVKNELERNGTATGEIRTDERDGKRFTVFFVVAPDGLCFYFHEPQDGE